MALKDEMAGAMESLRARVERAESVMEGSAALLSGLAEQLRRASADPAAIRALADGLDTRSDALQAAIAANTMAAEEPPAVGATTDTATGEATDEAATGEGGGKATWDE